MFCKDVEMLVISIYRVYTPTLTLNKYDRRNRIDWFTHFRLRRCCETKLSIIGQRSVYIVHTYMFFSIIIRYPLQTTNILPNLL